MAGVRIAYRFTFIDLEDGKADGAGRTQARSLSPLRTSANSDTLVVDTWAQRHLRTLRQGQDASVFDAPAPNRGSLGHPTLCSRPCIYFVKQGQCPHGDACGFCHHHHSTTPKPDKHQREWMSMMPRAQLLSLLAELLRERAEQDGLQGAGFVVAVVAVRAGLPCVLQALSKRELRKLHQLRQVLGAMNFFTMLSLAARYCEGRSRAVILQELRALRDSTQ
ncbi:hypothetical protein AK812_SmicGene12960 [Symbiodinium microadriaticum]|uniref:Uncharacterized protein n=1 Tax=Symbiodinium microadriaticum TaxID=2951 RepID=A0A1Q9E9D1_SYMMI|nr:hypothetical protein AK812_SmicGene12960 [Symbiodinium microadriaticum]CAE6913725.1 unnamed protein product [Symbiodinium sp. KB8]CAE7334610.1 unnamed protein product [Symbiodinium microadriaticum]